MTSEQWQKWLLQLQDNNWEQVKIPKVANQATEIFTAFTVLNKTAELGMPALSS
jgi:hypothetical protein